MSNDTYQSTNRKAWDDWTDDHVQSGEYGWNKVKSGGNSLPALDLDGVGDVHDKSLLHLMCHLGTDTISWARQGASATGLDFSPKSITAARQLAKEVDMPVHFIESDIYAAPTVLTEQFDIVYTSGGVICWLPDVPSWAQVVAQCLKPGGVFYLREVHPIFWALSQERDDNLMVIADNYFETGQPIIDEESNVGQSGEQTSYGWSHSMGEIVTALINAGLRIEFLHEHPTAGEDWSWLLPMRQREDERWELEEGRDNLPLEYSIRAIRDN